MVFNHHPTAGSCSSPRRPSPPPIPAQLNCRCQPCEPVVLGQVLGVQEQRASLILTPRPSVLSRKLPHLPALVLPLHLTLHHSRLLLSPGHSFPFSSAAPIVPLQMVLSCESSFHPLFSTAALNSVPSELPRGGSEKRRGCKWGNSQSYGNGNQSGRLQGYFLFLTSLHL